MHLFRWVRFLSWKRRRSSTTRRSSQWLLRHFHRDRSGRSSFVGAASASSISVSANFDLRPSMVYVDSDSLQRHSCEVRPLKKKRSMSPPHNTGDDDRRFIEEFHRQHGYPEAPSSSATLSRVSSILTPARPSTIMDRASIVNLFNQLQFEMPQPICDPPEGGESTEEGAVNADHSMVKKSKPKKKKGRKRTKAREAAEPGLPPEAELASESSFFRQYLLRTKSRLTHPDEPKFRPLSAAQCREYIQRHNVALDSVGISSTVGSGWEEPDPEPMQFLFFGGNSEENPHRVEEMESEQRRCRARFVADQPTPSCTTSIRIKPTLVRGLPAVFEPTFQCMYI